MSGLTLKGNITSNVGEYLPAPYIDQIVVEGEQTLRVRNSIFLQEKIGQDVNDGGNVVTATDAYQTAIANNIHVYCIYFFNMADTGFYEGIVNKEINPLALLALSASSYADASRTGTDPAAWGPGRIHRASANIVFESDKLETTYDENGNPVQKYSAETLKRLKNYSSEPPLWPNGWNEVNSFEVISFTSTIDVNDLPETEADINIPLLNAQVSDISHEKVFEKGRLMDRYRSEYVDDSSVIFNDTPIIGIDSAVYIPSVMTHEQIVANFQDLLSQYSGEYTKERGNVKLKRMMDKISFILEVYGDDADLLSQLDMLRKVFPDKTPSTPLGKFYKRFRQRISNINKAIKRGPGLRREIVYNSKIVDLRSVAEGTTVTVTYDASPLGENYIYKDWGASLMEVDMGPFTSDYEVAAGHFFFDYEKALRHTSNIAAIYDVSKLEKWGVHIPYKHFEVKAVNANRTGYASSIVEETGEVIISATDENIDIGCIFEEGAHFPTTEYCYVIENAGIEGEHVIVLPERVTETYDPGDGSEVTEYGFYDTPYGPPGPDSIKWNEGGYITSLVLRYYVNPTNIQFSTIDNYRMMCYELLDYQKDSIASDYAVTVSINDNTLDVVDALIEACTDAYALLEEYAGFVDHACSFNEDIGVFNSFFTEAMLAEYPDPTKAPWYVAPAHYLMHLDLIYNTYGGDSDEIVKVAQGLSQQISPAVGTKTALEDFQSTFKDFIDSVYGDSGTITATIETVKEKVEASFATTLAIPGRTSAHAVTTFESCVTDDDCIGGFTCQGGLCKFLGAEPEEILGPCTTLADYDFFLKDVEKLYGAYAFEGTWKDAVDKTAEDYTCQPDEHEYDLDPHPGGLCSENESYNGYVDGYIEKCTDLSNYPWSTADTYWELISGVLSAPCKVDPASKRNIDCEDCGEAAPNYHTKCLDLFGSFGAGAPG